MKALMSSVASALFIVPCQSATIPLPIEFTNITRNYQVSPNDFKTDAVVSIVNFDNFIENSQQTIIDDIRVLTTVKKMQEPSNLNAIGIFGIILLSSATYKTFSEQKK